MKTISTEKAFDMLPIVITIYEKLDMDEYRKELAKKLAEENKGKDAKDKQNINTVFLGIDLFKYIMKYSQKIKTEVFEIVSIAEDMTVKEVENQSLGKTISTLKDIFASEGGADAVELFKQAI